MARRKEPRIPNHLIDQLLAGAKAQISLCQRWAARRVEEGSGRASAQRRDGPSSQPGQ